jgi:hypothetical protein
MLERMAAARHYHTTILSAEGVSITGGANHAAVLSAETTGVKELPIRCNLCRKERDREMIPSSYKRSRKVPQRPESQGLSIWSISSRRKFASYRASNNKLYRWSFELTTRYLGHRCRIVLPLFQGIRSSSSRRVPIDCGICLEDNGENGGLETLHCLHTFCTNCISQWLRRNSRCPYRCELDQSVETNSETSQPAS